MSTTCQRGKHTTAFVLLSLLAGSSLAISLPCEDPVLITQFTDASEFVSNAPLTLGGDGFIMEADVRVDGVNYMGRVFEFSNGMEKNNVILAINSKGQWEYHVWQGAQHIILIDPVPGPCCGVFMHVALVVTATSQHAGFARLFFDGIERVSASGPLPVLDTRTDNHIYTSTFPGDVPLNGVVANFRFSTCRAKTQVPPTAVPVALPCEDPVLITQFTDSSEFVSNAPLTLGGDGFIMEADVRVDGVNYMGRVFEFSNGMEKNNVILAINSKGQWEYHVWQGAQHIILIDPVPGPCCGVFMHVALVVTATSHDRGSAKLFFDGVERVSASGPLPVLDTRTDNHIYTSTFPGDVPLNGVVANFRFSTCRAKTQVPPTAVPVALPCEDPVLITQFTDSSEFVSNAPLTLGGDGFIMEADVRVDGVNYMGRVFEFSNGMEKNNVILAINSKGQWEYHVWQGAQHIILIDPVPGPCCGVFMHVALVVTATSHDRGSAKLFFDGVERVSASGPLPVLDTRTDNHIYTSTFPGDVPLNGVVANFRFSTCRAKTQVPPTAVPPFTVAIAVPTVPLTLAPPTAVPVVRPVHEMHRVVAFVTDGYVTLSHFRTMSRCKTQICAL